MGSHAFYLNSESYITCITSSRLRRAIRHTDYTQETADPDTPAVTSNTARPANDTSKSNIKLSKRGILTGNKVTQQTKEIDTNSTSNKK